MIQKFMSYVLFWKKDRNNETANFNLKVMHGINKISILLFLLAVILILFKYVLA